MTPPIFGTQRLPRALAALGLTFAMAFSAQPATALAIPYALGTPALAANGDLPAPALATNLSPASDEPALEAAADTSVTVVVTVRQSEARKLLAMVNEARAKVGRAALTWSNTLEDIAIQRAAETTVSFSHTRPNGEVCFSLWPAQTMGAAENIAAGQPDAAAVNTSWTNSPGHYANMTHASMSSFGAACVLKDGVPYWVECFAKEPGGGMSGSALEGKATVVVPLVPGGAGGIKKPKPQTRLDGPTRYDTMARIVREGFSKSDWAVVTTGANFPDALAASSLAGALKCPIVLTSGSSLSAQARELLSALGVKKVHIMGDVSAVGGSVEDALKGMGIQTSRVRGEDRYATSAATLTLARGISHASNTVVVATGTKFPDALSISPWAYSTASPIVLAKADGLLSDSVLAAIKADGGISHVLIVGGTSAVSEGIKQQLGAGYTFERLGEASRYATSARIASWAAAHGLAWETPAVATGTNFPDALSGACLLGSKKSVLLLADSGHDDALAALGSNAATIKSTYVLGGAAALSDALASAVADAAM